MAYTLKDYFKRIRENGATATRAMELARKNMEAKRPLYDIPRRAFVEYNKPFDGAARYVENPSEGLRLVGYADKVASRIRHEGWFTDEFQDNKFRGVVYRLPARNGKSLFIAGYEEEESDRTVLDFSTIHDCEIAAAHAGDSMAQSDAEKQRESNEAYLAGSQFYNCGIDLENGRQEVKQYIAALRESKPHSGAIGETAKETIRKALHSEIKKALADMNRARIARAKLLEEYGAAWRKELLEAFNDGAGFIAIKE